MGGYKMEKFMVVVCMEGSLKAYFFRYPENAKKFNLHMSRLYSTKLYVYIPDTDSWESSADQF